MEYSFSRAGFWGLVFALVFGGIAFGAESSPGTEQSITLDEEKLIALSKKKNPSSDEIESLYLTTRTQQAQFNDEFSGSIQVKGSTAETNERPLISFVPVFSPTKEAEISYNKKFKFGMDLSTGFVVTRQTASALDLDKATTNNAFVSLEFDLWKDIFGRNSYARERSFEQNEKRASLQRDVNKRVFELNLRRVFWQLVANEESRKINQELKGSADKQLKDAQRRQKQSVSDRGEVARYRAQLASRDANLAYLKFQKSSLIREIQMALPELQNSKVELGSVNIEDTTEQVLACAKVIGKYEEPPLDHTFYDDMAAAVEKENVEATKVHKNYNDIDLKLNALVGAKGVDNTNPGSVGRAWRDLADNNRYRYQVGLELTIPIGTGDTESLLIARDRYQAESQASKLRAELRSSHAQFTQSLSLLVEATQLSKLNSDNLQIRVKDMLKKYNQARISVTELITDQDAYLSAVLSVIDIQLQLLNAVIDYLAIFTETPCEFNKSAHMASATATAAAGRI